MKKIDANSPNVVKEAVKILRAGGLVMHPTETCYGLAVDVFNKQAIDKLYKVKGMAQDKPVSILVADYAMAEEYGAFTDQAFELAQKYWPGALSIIIPRKRTLPDFFNRNEDFVSIRCSSDELCQKIVKELENPVTTTSANPAGEPPLYIPDESVFADWAENIDLIIDGGEISKIKPSTIVKIDNQAVNILRQGDIFIDESGK